MVIISVKPCLIETKIKVNFFPAILPLRSKNSDIENPASLGFPLRYNYAGQDAATGLSFSFRKNYAGQDRATGLGFEFTHWD
jgi:hypothetical protein